LLSHAISIGSYVSDTRQIAVHEHQEADQFRANLPTPGKVETAKAGCGYARWQPREAAACLRAKPPQSGE